MKRTADDNQSKKLEKLATPSGVRRLIDCFFFRLRESKEYNNFKLCFKLGKHGVHAQTTHVQPKYQGKLYFKGDWKLSAFCSAMQEKRKKKWIRFQYFHLLISYSDSASDNTPDKSVLFIHTSYKNMIIVSITPVYSLFYPGIFCGCLFIMQFLSSCWHWQSLLLAIF